jgi:hypothetical protein
MFPSFPCYKEGTGGRGQIQPGPPVVRQNTMLPVIKPLYGSCMLRKKVISLTSDEKQEVIKFWFIQAV